MLRIKRMRPVNITAQFFIITLIILSITMGLTFVVSYEIAKQQVLDVGGEMFSNCLKDAVGFIDAMNRRVESGDIGLEEAQETARTYLLGPKDQNGLRDISKSKMSANDYMYIWAIHPDGTMAMHPFNFENQNIRDLVVGGRHPVKETWANPAKSGRVFREIWQNPGEPVYTFIAYQEYYAPWDWVIGAGGREEVIYTKRLETMKYTFLSVTALIYFVAFALIFIFSRRWTDKLNKINHALNEVSRGNLKQSIDFKLKDEFGTLADSFNNMATNLQKLLGSGALHSIHDKSEQYLRMLSESESRLLNMVHSRVLTAQEEERGRLARDLHDRIGQALYSVAIAVRLANKETNLRGSARKYLQDVEAATLQAMSELKSIINEIRPTSLEKYGLLPAIKTYISTFEARWNIKVHFQKGTVKRRYPKEIELAVYRVFQEALHNAGKHAHTEEIDVCLQDSERHLELTVRDYGAGFHVSDKHPGKDGFGLYGMKERVVLLEGVFEIESEPGEGTKIRVWIPLGEPGFE